MRGGDYLKDTQSTRGAPEMLDGWEEKRVSLAACCLDPRVKFSFIFTSQSFAPRDQGSKFKRHRGWVKPLVKLRKKSPWHRNSTDHRFKFKHRHKPFRPLIGDSGVMPPRIPGLHERQVRRLSPPQQQRYREKFYSCLFTRCWLCIFFFSLDDLLPILLFHGSREQAQSRKEDERWNSMLIEVWWVMKLKN